MPVRAHFAIAGQLPYPPDVPFLVVIGYFPLWVSSSSLRVQWHSFSFLLTLVFYDSQIVKAFRPKRGSAGEAGHAERN